MNQSTTYRVGMIGVGRMGTTHARGYKFHPRTEVVAATDTDSENLTLFCERFGVPGYSDFRDMLRNERIDIAAPVLPVRANVETVLGCVNAGVKAVFCEKPFAATLADADRMVEQCRLTNTAFSVGYVQRNYPQLWSARDLINSGELGAPLYVDLYHNLNQIGCQWQPVVNLFAGDAEVEYVVGEVEGDAFSDEQALMKGVGGLIKFANGMDCYAHYRSWSQERRRGLCASGVFSPTMVTASGYARLRRANLVEERSSRRSPRFLPVVTARRPTTTTVGCCRRSSPWMLTSNPLSTPSIMAPSPGPAEPICFGRWR